MPENIKPTADRLLVRVAKPKATTLGGIVLPEVARQGQTQRGEVLAVGPGKPEGITDARPVSIAVGAVVVYSPFAGQAIAEDMVLLSESDVLAVVE